MGVVANACKEEKEEAKARKKMQQQEQEQQQQGGLYVKVMTDEQLEVLRKQISVYATICEELVKLHKVLTAQQDSLSGLSLLNPCPFGFRFCPFQNFLMGLRFSHLGLHFFVCK